jgi:hypothetical protein
MSACNSAAGFGFYGCMLWTASSIMHRVPTKLSSQGSSMCFRHIVHRMSQMQACILMFGCYRGCSRPYSLLIPRLLNFVKSSYHKHGVTRSMSAPRFLQQLYGRRNFTPVMLTAKPVSSTGHFGFRVCCVAVAGLAATVLRMVLWSPQQRYHLWHPIKRQCGVGRRRPSCSGWI